MKTSQLSLILLFSTYAAAWPWPAWLPELDALIVRRDSNSTTSASEIASPSATATDGSASKTDSSTSASKTDSGGTTLSMSGTGSKTTGSTKTGSSSKTTSSSHTSYDARLPAGGISLLTPAATAGSQFYKIGDYVTFAWNYTSLSATPTAVNVFATCTDNQAMYTISANMTVSNATQQVVWDTGAYSTDSPNALQTPLITDKYTLIIYDAAGAVTEAASAGYLAPFDTYSFGMYVPQPYTPLGEYVCATCSGALSEGERRALGMVVGMSILTFMSFTWFVAGTGVIW